MGGTYTTLFDIYLGQYRRTGSDLREESWVKDVAKELEGFHTQVGSVDALFAAFDAGKFTAYRTFADAANSQITLLKARLEALSGVLRSAQEADSRQVQRAPSLDQSGLRRKANEQKDADDQLCENLGELTAQADRSLKKDESELRPQPQPQPGPQPKPEPIPPLDPQMAALQQAFAQPPLHHESRLVNRQSKLSGAAAQMPRR